MPKATKAELKKLNKKNAKGVSHNLKDTMGARVIHTIDTAGTHVVVGGKVENIQVCPEGNELLPKTQRKYFYPPEMRGDNKPVGNWVTYMRARRLLKECGKDIFSLPVNKIQKKEEVKEPESK